MPPADERPKLSHVLMANSSSSSSLTTRPGHWSATMGIVRYASATSRMAAWEPGGRLKMVKQMVAKVPHVQGYMSASMELLMEATSGVGVRGKEKLWTARYLPGFPALGTHDRGDDWKGPIRASISWRVHGPMYRPFPNSLETMSRYASGCRCKVGLLEGV